MQGEIRSYRDSLKGWLKQFTELSSKDLGRQSAINVPEELPFYATIGFHRILVLEEYKRFHMNWSALFVFILGALQVVAGALLCAMGAVNFGNGLISEGVSDMVQGMMGMITGNFNLLDWAKSKALNVAIALITGGLKALKSVADTAKNVHGALTKGQMFAKAIGRACTDFVMELGGELISQYGIGPLMTMTQEAIFTGLEPEIKKLIKLDGIKEQLMQIYKQKGEIEYKTALYEFEMGIAPV